MASSDVGSGRSEPIQFTAAFEIWIPAFAGTSGWGYPASALAGVASRSAAPSANPSARPGARLSTWPE